MADTTLQYDWIVRLKGGVEASCPTAFVAGDLLWYYEEGNPAASVAPDVLVAFGRPRGPRMSYFTWEEGGVVPQVVIEVWSPSNRSSDRVRKLFLYERLGVQEFIAFDPAENALAAYVRSGDRFREVEIGDEWTSPHLGIRFVPGSKLEVYGPDGRRLPFHEELQAELARATNERDAATTERDAALARAEALAAQLRAAGIDPG